MTGFQCSYRKSGATAPSNPRIAGGGIFMNGRELLLTPREAASAVRWAAVDGVDDAAGETVLMIGNKRDWAVPPVATPFTM